MSNKWATLRNRAYQNQHGRCHYCGCAMWQSDPQLFARHHGLSLRQAAEFQATAEHLVARCDGGKDIAANIVAACRCCNHRRHGRKTVLSPERYCSLVRQRVAAGKWHPELKKG